MAHLRNADSSSLVALSERFKSPVAVALSAGGGLSSPLMDGDADSVPVGFDRSRLSLERLACAKPRPLPLPLPLTPPVVPRPGTAAPLSLLLIVAPSPLSRLSLLRLLLLALRPGMRRDAAPASRAVALASRAAAAAPAAASFAIGSSRDN